MYKLELLLGSCINADPLSIENDIKKALTMVSKKCYPVKSKCNRFMLNTLAKFVYRFRHPRPTISSVTVHDH